MQNIAWVLVHTESWKCRLSILEGDRQDHHNQKEHLTGCRNTGCLAQRRWTRSLLDGNHVYLAPSEDKKATWERDGKSVESSQRAIQRDPVVALSMEAEAGRDPGRGKAGSASQERQSTKKVTCVQLLLCHPSGGLLTVLFNWDWRKATTQLFLCCPNNYQSTKHTDYTQNAPERISFPSKQKS